MFDQFYTTLESLGIVPVVVLDKVEDAAPLAHALMAAGMKSAEVTFRTACAAECIAAMAKAEPEMCVGAGTVLTVEQVEQARAAGAKFIVSPGYNEDVVKHCIDIDLPVLPGTVTPSEVTAAVNLGLKVTKFFPAAQYGGLNTIKALAAPFVGHRFMPTGGVSTANVEEYLSSSAIIACGGTWMVKPALFADGDFSKVEQIARELGIRREEVVFAMDAVCDPVSLFEPIYSDGGDAVCVMDQVRDTKNTDEDWLEQIALKEAMARLSERERQILALRYSDGKTQMEVSAEIGISQAQVSRLEKTALGVIRKNL